MYVSFGLEIFIHVINIIKIMWQKFSFWNNRFSALVGRLSKLERFSPLFLTTTPVGRFGISFFLWVFWTWIFFTCVKTLTMFLLQNFHVKKNNFSILGRMSKLAAVKHFLHLPLVSKYWISFFYQSSSFGTHVFNPTMILCLKFHV